MLKRTSVVTSAALLVVASVGIARAQYPNKALTFIVPFPPGGASNLIGRAIAKPMAKNLGQPITVMNRSGAAGTVGAADIARATPDGYTIGILTSTPLLMKPHTTKLPYNLSSFKLVCRAFDNPLILTVNAKSPIKTFADFLKQAKADHGTIKYYTEGPGSLQDIAMSDLETKAKFKAIGVPMKGHQAAVRNLLAGVIDIAPLTAGSVLSNPDLLRPIAIMSANKVEKPNVPTLRSLGYDVVYSLTGAIVAPKGISQAKYNRLVSACAAAQRSKGFTTMLDKFNMPHSTETGPTFAKILTQQYNAIGAYMKAHHMNNM